MIEMTEQIIYKIEQLKNNRTPVYVGIDGRCAAGKTTLAAYLQNRLACSVIHMDDFFLRPEQRTEERYREAGGNIDYERFQQEVLQPLRQGKSFHYRPYDCQQQQFGKEIVIEAKPVMLLEGTYSCHPLFREYYHLRIFLTLEPEEQLRRIRERNGAEALELFQKKWIPLEEDYFFRCQVKEQSDICIHTIQLS